MPEDNPATPPTPGDTERILPPSAVAPGAAVTNPAAVAPDNRPAVDVLYIQGLKEGDLTAHVDLYLGYRFGGTGGVVRHEQADTWDGVARILQKYSSIGRLFIIAHSATDGIMVGVELKSVPQIKELLKTAGNMPVIRDEIHIEGCVIGKNPVELLDLAKFFKVPKLYAYNYFHVVAVKSIPEAKAYAAGDEDKAKSAIREVLAPWGSYFTPGVPSVDEMASAYAAELVEPGLQTVYFPVEWYVPQQYVGENPTEPVGGKYEYRTRSSAEDNIIRTTDDALKLQEEFALWEFRDSQAPPFYRVIIQPI